MAAVKMATSHSLTSLIPALRPLTFNACHNRSFEDDCGMHQTVV
jgi:hypothetical protein